MAKGNRRVGRWSVGAIALSILVGCGTAPAGIHDGSDRSVSSKAILDRVKDIVLRDARAGFDAYDTNHDGHLTPSEVPFLRPETFQAMDRNHDGQIDWNEGAPSGSELDMAVDLTKEVLTHWYRKLDKNHDGLLTADELADGDTLPTEMVSEARHGMTFESFVRSLDHQGQLMTQRSAAPMAHVASGAKPPVVMVPGFFLPTMIWVSLGHRLSGLGWTEQITVPHWPSFGDIRDVSAATEFRVKQLQARTGATKIEFIGHSMGGLVLRYYIKHLGGDALGAHYISFGTPQHGTVIGHAWPVTSCKQMYPNSDFLTELNSDTETPGNFRYTSIRTNTDEIVLSETSPILKGADNYLVPFAEHLELVFDPSAQQIALDALNK